MKDNQIAASELMDKMNEVDSSSEKTGKYSGKRKSGRAARRKAYKKNKRRKKEQARILSLNECARQEEAEKKETSKKPMPPRVERANELVKKVAKNHYN